MIKRILSALAVALVSGFVASAQEYKGPELTPEFVCDLGQITPENDNRAPVQSDVRDIAAVVSLAS